MILLDTDTLTLLIVRARKRLGSPEMKEVFEQYASLALAKPAMSLCRLWPTY